MANSNLSNFYPGISVGNAGLGLKMPVFDPRLHTVYFNDFHNYTAGDWTLTETDSAATEALATGHGGILLITNTGADNDVTSIQLGTTSFAFASGRKAWMEFRFKASEATDIDLFLGLAVTDTSPIASLPSTYAAFVKDDDAATLVFKTSAGANSGAIKTIVADTFYKVGMYYDGAQGLDVFVDDILVYSSNAAFASLFGTADVRLTMAIQAGAAAAKTLSVDYALVAFER